MNGIFLFWIRSGTEEEYSELHQLLEDIQTYRSDCVEFVNKEKKNRINKEKEDKEKGEELRRLALTGMASEFIVNHSFDYYYVSCWIMLLYITII